MRETLDERNACEPQIAPLVFSGATRKDFKRPNPSALKFPEKFGVRCNVNKGDRAHTT